MITSRGHALPETSVAGRGSRIVQFDISPIEIGLTEPFSISSGAPTVARSVLVRVVLHDGTVGYGEAAPFEAITGETQAGVLAALRAVAPEVEGRDAAEWRMLSAVLGDVLAASPAARCAVEQAVIDAFARHLGIPLSTFLGGPATPMVTDITIPAGDVEHSAASARRAASSGFSTVKVKVGADDWETDVARLVAIHRSEPGLSITVDANAGYSRAQAGRFLEGVVRAGVDLKLVEQPLAAEDIAGLGMLEKKFGIPVCADESVFTPADAVRVVGAGHISVINVKLMKTGVADALDIVAVARAAGLRCMIGGMIETAVSMSFSAALAAAHNSVFAYIDLDTPLFMRNVELAGGMQYAGEVISLPVADPGTGIDASAYFPAVEAGAGR